MKHKFIVKFFKVQIFRRNLSFTFFAFKNNFTQIQLSHFLIESLWKGYRVKRHRLRNISNFWKFVSLQRDSFNISCWRITYWHQYPKGLSADRIEYRVSYHCVLEWMKFGTQWSQLQEHDKFYLVTAFIPEKFHKKQ